MSAAEPTPWCLGGCNGRGITTPSGYVGDGLIADCDTLANAEHIVRCVNSHPALLEALRGIIAILEPKELEHCTKKMSEHGLYLGHAANAAMDLARAAIKQAGVEL